MKVYRIKNIKTNMYSSGGYNPKWIKTGKIWKNIGHLKNHLNMFKYELGFKETPSYFVKTNINIPITIYNNLDDWEIIEYALTEIYDMCSTWSSKQFINEMKHKKDDFETCFSCNGSGQFFNGYASKNMICEICNGTGKLPQGTFLWYSNRQHHIDENMNNWKNEKVIEWERLNPKP